MNGTGSLVEIHSALARKVRTGELQTPALQQALRRFYAALRLAQQKSWFATHLPGHVLLIRQGRYWEVVVPPTTSAADTAVALDALRAWPRRVPRRRLSTFKPVLWRGGLPVAWIGETGRRLGTIAERALHCRWAVWHE
jgi:hypothetical protein